VVDRPDAWRDALRRELARVRRRDLVLGLLRGELLADLVGVERRVRPRRPRVAQVVLDAVERRKLCAGLDLRGGAAVTARPANPRATRPSMSTGASATSTSTSMPSVLDSEAPICLLL
jgi:hypothetical protein